MANPQAGILGEPGSDHYFLEFSLPRGVPDEDVARALGAAYGALGGAAGLQAVLGFSRPLWASLAAGDVPPLLAPFRTMTGRNGKTVPGTQNDLWLWLHGKGPDRLFAAAREAGRLLGEIAALRLEQPAFHYLDSRDLTGFIDGTANPQGGEAREAALIGEGEAGAGGSYLIAMRWEHDLAAFHALSESAQEQVIGRRKADSEELPEAEKPETAHISRAEIERDGEELAIFRRSVPFGTLGRHGLYFLAFSHDPGRFDLMLRRMYGLTEDGIEDRLTDFSRPTSAAYYFAPPQQALEQALGMGLG